VTTASTAPKKKKAAPKKVTDADVVKRLSALQRTGISSADRAAVTQVIRLLS
jgi:hypothetical protein